jgi:hypothetical protein
VKIKTPRTGPRWWKPAWPYGSPRGVPDQDGNMNGMSALPLVRGTSAPETCSICGKLITPDQRTVTVHQVRNGSDPRPPQAPAHPSCFRQEFLKN